MKKISISLKKKKRKTKKTKKKKTKKKQFILQVPSSITTQFSNEVSLQRKHCPKQKDNAKQIKADLNKRKKILLAKITIYILKTVFLNFWHNVSNVTILRRCISLKVLTRVHLTSYFSC